MAFTVGQTVKYSYVWHSTEDNTVETTAEVVAINGDISISIPDADNDFEPYDTATTHPVALLVKDYPFENMTSVSGVVFSELATPDGVCLTGATISEV